MEMEGAMRSRVWDVQLLVRYGAPVSSAFEDKGSLDLGLGQ